MSKSVLFFSVFFVGPASLFTPQYMLRSRLTCMCISFCLLYVRGTDTEASRAMAMATISRAATVDMADRIRVTLRAATTRQVTAKASRPRPPLGNRRKRLRAGTHNRGQQQPRRVTGRKLDTAKATASSRSVERTAYVACFLTTLFQSQCLFLMIFALVCLGSFWLYIQLYL